MPAAIILIFIQFSLTFTFGSILIPNELQRIASSDIKLLNTFSGCYINVINFYGLDINFLILTQPIILQRYFSFLYLLDLFPYEMGPTESHKNLIWTINTFFLHNKKVIYQNRTIILNHDLSSNNVENVLANDKLRSFKKKLRCNNLLKSTEHTYNKTHTCTNSLIHSALY